MLDMQRCLTASCRSPTHESTSWTCAVTGRSSTGDLLLRDYNQTAASLLQLCFTPILKQVLNLESGGHETLARDPEGIADVAVARNMILPKITVGWWRTNWVNSGVEIWTGWRTLWWCFPRLCGAVLAVHCLQSSVLTRASCACVYSGTSGASASVRPRRANTESQSCCRCFILSVTLLSGPSSSVSCFPPGYPHNLFCLFMKSFNEEPFNVSQSDTCT